MNKLTGNVTLETALRRPQFVLPLLFSLFIGNQTSANAEKIPQFDADVAQKVLIIINIHKPVGPSGATGELSKLPLFKSCIKLIKKAIAAEQQRTMLWAELGDGVEPCVGWPKELAQAPAEITSQFWTFNSPRPDYGRSLKWHLVKSGLRNLSNRDDPIRIEVYRERLAPAEIRNALAPSSKWLAQYRAL